MNEPLSFKVQTTLAAQRFVAQKSGAANTVEYPSAANILPIGITVDTVKDTNQAIPVKGVGQVAKLYFNDTVTTGGLVASDTSGRGVPFSLAQTTTTLTLPSAYGGILIGPASVAATGTIAEVLIMPGFQR